MSKHADWRLSQTRDARKHRSFRARKRAKGLCSRCPKPATEGLATCVKCRTRGKAYQRQIRGTSEGTIEDARKAK